MLLYPFNKAQLILEHVFATGTKCPDITFTCPLLALGPAMSLRIPGFFEWEMVFQNKELSVRYAYCYWSIIASRPL